MKLSIRTKLVLSLGSLIFILLLVFWYACHVMVSRALTHHQRVELQMHADRLATHLNHLSKGQANASTNVSEKFAALIYQYKIGQSGYGIVLDRSGALLVRIQDGYATKPLIGDGQGFDDLLHHAEHLKPYCSRATIYGVDSLVALVPIGSNDLSVAAILPHAELAAKVAPLKTRLTIVMLIALTFSVLILMVVANRIVRPLRKLVHATKDIGKGHFDTTELSVRTNDEFGLLAASFRRMAGLLEKKNICVEDARKNLEAKNTQLEKEVARRTYQLESSNAQLKQESEGRIAAQAQREHLADHIARAQSMEALGTLAGGIAHNFNNLLMGIGGCASILLLNKNTGHPDYEKLNQIGNLVKDGAELTEQLLGYAREGKYESRRIDLNRMVADTAAAFTATHTGIAIHRHLGESLPNVHADRRQLELMLVNIYLNAVDAMPNGGDLYITTCRKSMEQVAATHAGAQETSYISLSIKDTGMGMDNETREQIFDPFFTTKGMANSNGLGLASVYGIIHAHGGYIDVESEEGNGTVFTVYLPTTANDETMETAVEKDIHMGDETVMLVDDEEIVRDVGQDMLESLGYRVYAAKSGLEALELYEKHKHEIKLILLDMIMPGMGGGKTFDCLKEMNHDIKVLLSSGYTYDGEAREIISRGCNGFIQKPFDMEELSNQIRSAMAS